MNNSPENMENLESLKSKLEEKKADFELNANNHIKTVFKAGIASVRESGVLDKAKKVGEIAPDFELNNALGKPVALSDYLKKGKVVLTWYRGGWCPYCNMTLQQLQREVPGFNANGASLIALTPELPDKSMSTVEKQNLQFEVLSDVGNEIARAYGIVFKLADDVAEIYDASFGMRTYNGDDSYELPLAATYIINEDGKIIYAFLDADHRKRAEPSELTAFLKENQ
ncbi:peroxiredoxin-like family protein [Maribacter sp. TH_r10]|uniref:peroxiredoxin-like family protein n=1 Tax=Maribacter sp. TH_r10 TaxID=3082086 RepID=UPI002953FB4F|nr:peroxiredoxin-like family protein [Maribacter sp. TH_r10]